MLRASSASTFAAALLGGSDDRISARSVDGALPIRNGEEVAAVERRVGEADERFVAAAVMPGQQRRRKVLRRLSQEAVGVQVDLDALALLLDDHAFVLAAGTGEELGRRQLHLVAHDDDLVRAIDRGNGLLQRDLAGLVEDDHVEQVGIERQRVGDAQRAHQPDRLQILDDLAGVARRQIANGFVAHRLAELVFEVAPAGRIGFLEGLLLRLQLRGRQ